MNRFKFILFTLCLILLISCSSGEYKQDREKPDYKKPYSWGHKQKIFIFADNSVWKKAKPILKKTLERYHFTTENEKYFTIERAAFEDIEEFYKYNNLLFLASINSQKPVSSYVQSIMSAKIKAEVRENLVGLYPNNNLWARNQFVLFALGNNELNLLKSIQLQQNKIFEVFQQHLFKKISQEVYRQELYPEKRFQSLPFTLKLTKNYIVYKKGQNFISFLNRVHGKPDRFLAVFYEKMKTDNVSKDWLIQKRKELVWKYYDEDEFDGDRVKQEKYEIAGYEGYKISGRWQNKKHFVGGTFQTFAFYDEAAQKAFLIDNSVYYPDADKLPALIELEVISQTFNCKTNVSK